MPVTEDDLATQEIFQTRSAPAYVTQERRLESIRNAGAGQTQSSQPSAPKTVVASAS